MIVLPPVSLPMALLGLPHPSLTTMAAILGGVVLALWLCAIVASRPPVKARMEAGHGHAVHWIDDAIAAWEAEGRLAGDEADRLRTELREPSFVAVLPHFGVHLAIGVALRFPIGSITRGLYVLANMGLAHARFAARRTDYPTFRRSMSIHSPLVLVLTCMPGIGTFAYLASKPFRSHHLLTRVALDAVLLKLPKDVYERSGTRPILTRPAGWATRPEPHGGQEPGLRLHVVPARLMAVLTLIALGLFAIDVGVTLVDEILSPSFLGWEPVMRILDLNAESSFGTWFAVVMLLLLAVVLALIARGKRASGDGFALHWAGLAVIALGLSIDEQAKLHDLGSGFGAEMRERLGLGGVLYYGWVIIAAITVVTLAVIYWRFVVALPSATRTRLIVAAGLFLAGEMGMEMIGGAIMDRDGATLAYQLSTSVEEFLGLLGVLVAFGTLLAYGRTSVGALYLEVMRFDPEPADVPTVSAIAILPEARRETTEPVGATGK